MNSIENTTKLFKLVNYTVKAIIDVQHTISKIQVPSTSNLIHEIRIIVRM